MTKRAKTEKEFADAMKDDPDTIEIEGDLKNKIIRIKATGKIAWGICFASATVAIAAMALVPATGCVATPAALTLSS